MIAMPRWVLGASVVASLGACASAGGAGGSQRLAESGDHGQLGFLEQRADEQTRRIGELEARIALLEQEARLSRESGPMKPTETVRIGRHVRDAEAEAVLASTTHERGPADERVPSLRLVGESRDEEWSAPLPRPGMPASLSVVPLPAATSGSATAPVPVAPANAGDDTRARYRAALKLVRERDFEHALEALGQFLAEHPNDALTDDAMYWRGEAHYAQRRYREALDAFAEVLARFPTGSRVPDALLKVGMCHHRLGDATSARAYFRRVREEYPDTEAARLVPEEGST